MSEIKNFFQMYDRIEKLKKLDINNLKYDTVN